MITIIILQTSVLIQDSETVIIKLKHAVHALTTILISYYRLYDDLALLIIEIINLNTTLFEYDQI